MASAPRPCLTAVTPPRASRHQHQVPGQLGLLSRSPVQRVSIPHNLSHQARMSATNLALALLPRHTHTHTHSPSIPLPPWATHMRALLCLFGFLSPPPPLSVLHSLFIQQLLGNAFTAPQPPLPSLLCWTGSTSRLPTSARDQFPLYTDSRPIQHLTSHHLLSPSSAQFTLRIYIQKGFKHRFAEAT